MSGNITVSSEFIRDLSIACMDDQHGINEKGFEFISELCTNSGNDDIVLAADAVNGRFFLPEDFKVSE